jgi:hypothetical protein
VAGQINQDKYNIQFAEEQADLKIRMELMLDAINAMDAAIRGTFDVLIDQGLLPEDAVGVRNYEKALDKLRTLGLKQAKPKPGGAQVKCPGCNSMLRIKGAPGERCEWCGHEF